MDNIEIRGQRNQLVVKGNDLVQKATYKLTATQQKFLAYLISKIKPSDQDIQEYEIRVEDFCQIAGIDKTYFYSDFIKMINDFDNRTFWIDTEDELYKFYWFSDATYLKGTGTIKLTLSKRLSKYLIGLSKNFTQYELYNVLALKSKYSIRMFELFKSYAYQKVKEFDIDELKELLQTQNYSNFKDFRKRVLEPAIREINEFTELEVSYEEEKKGRKVIKIIFKIKQKGSLKAYEGYQKTMERLDEKAGQIKGQLSIYDVYNDLDS